MRALKIAGAAIAAVIVVIALLLVVGVPSGFLTSTIQERVERDTGYKLTINGATKIGLWPSLNVTMKDVTLTDPKDRDVTNRLTAASIEADVTLASVWSGKPEITELVIVRPVLNLPLQRERARDTAAASKPVGSGDGFSIEHIVVTGGTVVFSNLRDRVESKIDGINADVTMAADRKLRVTGNARTGEHPLKFDVKATMPAPPLERQNIPAEFTLRCAGPVAGGAVGQGRGAAQRHGADDQRPVRHVRRRRLQRLGLGRFREQAAGQARSRLPAAQHRDGQERAALAEGAVEQCHDRSCRAQLCRRQRAHLRSPAQSRRHPTGAGRDRGHACQRRAEAAGRQSRRLWRTGQCRPDHRCVHRRADLRAAERPRRRAGAAAAAELGRFRQARRQDAGKDRGAFRRQQPARDHDRHERHGVRAVPGRPAPRPQRRADDPRAHHEHAVRLAGEQGAGDRSVAALRLVQDRQGPGHDLRPQPRRPAGQGHRRRHHRSRHQADRLPRRAQTRA